VIEGSGEEPGCPSYPQNCLGSPAPRRMPLAVCLDLIFVGTVNGRSLCGLIQIS